jgi:hypothetical protein
VDALASVAVLAATTSLGGSALFPAAGCRAASPYSSALFSLNGTLAASACVAATFRSSRSLDARPVRAGPLVVVRETDLAAGAEVRGDLAFLLDPPEEAARADRGLRVAMGILSF